MRPSHAHARRPCNRDVLLAQHRPRPPHARPPHACPPHASLQAVGFPVSSVKSASLHTHRSRHREKPALVALLAAVRARTKHELLVRANLDELSTPTLASSLPPPRLIAPPLASRLSPLCVQEATAKLQEALRSSLLMASSSPRKTPPPHALSPAGHARASALSPAAPPCGSYAYAASLASPPPIPSPLSAAAFAPAASAHTLHGSPRPQAPAAAALGCLVSGTAVDPNDDPHNNLRPPMAETVVALPTVAETVIGSDGTVLALPPLPAAETVIALPPVALPLAAQYFLNGAALLAEHHDVAGDVAEQLADELQLPGVAHAAATD